MAPRRKRNGRFAPTPELVRRQHAVQATLGKYRGRAFDWKAGVTCVHMLRFHLKRMGRKVPRVPKLRTAADGLAALRKHGWANVGEMLDGIGLQRIAPAAMRLGDIAVLEGDEGLGGIVISLGGKAMGWHEDAAEMVVMDLLKLDHAWRA